MDSREKAQLLQEKLEALRLNREVQKAEFDKLDIDSLTVRDIKNICHSNEHCDTCPLEYNSICGDYVSGWGE